MLEADAILSVLADAVQCGRDGIWIKVAGCSMGPAFADVVDIRVAPCRDGRIPCGSLVVYQRSGRWVVHRVMRCYVGDGVRVYRVKGDGLARADEPDVQAEEIKGVVCALRFRSGRVVDAGSWVWRMNAWRIVVGFSVREWWARCGRGPGRGRQE